MDNSNLLLFDIVDGIKSHGYVTVTRQETRDIRIVFANVNKILDNGLHTLEGNIGEVFIHEGKFRVYLWGEQRFVDCQSSEETLDCIIKHLNSYVA